MGLEECRSRSEGEDTDTKSQQERTENRQGGAREFAYLSTTTKQRIFFGCTEQWIDG
jgi:hypothetical protein